jgi:hypothetical protein
MSTFDSPSGIVPDQASTPEEIAKFVVEATINAPSVNNTQPWWFYGVDREIGMHADDERRQPVADPEGREMMISCGAALFTARVALRYLGIVPKVRVLPEQDVPADRLRAGTVRRDPQAPDSPGRFRPGTASRRNTDSVADRIL